MYLLENNLTYLQYTNIKKKRERERNRAVDTKLDFDYHPDLSRVGKSGDTAHLELRLGKNPR